MSNESSTATKHIEVVSFNRESRVCFNWPANVLHTLHANQQELGFRFSDSLELIKAFEQESVFGANLVSINVFANEAQKMGALGYRAKDQRIEIGTYWYFMPEPRPGYHTVLISKKELFGIRFYPENYKSSSEELIQVAHALADFIDAVRTACKES